jgi:hypothetical protein
MEPPKLLDMYWDPTFFKVEDEFWTLSDFSLIAFLWLRRSEFIIAG